MEKTEVSPVLGGYTMYSQTVDLYRYFGRERDGAAGHLTCLSWRPAEGVGARREGPAVLVLPGGGYQYTSGREAEPVAMRFAAKGYQTFILRYSCDPSRFPTALREAAMAMCYIRQNREQYAVAANMVAAVGFSAGGHLCGTLGCLYDCPEVTDIAPPEVLRPDALGLCYPVAVSWGATNEGSFRMLCGEDLQLRRRLSLEKLVRPDMPPVYLWHTADDGAVPVRNSLLLAQALDEAGVNFAMRIYPHGPHGVSLANELVYPAGQVPPMSGEIPGWPEDMAAFWADCGLGFREEAQV